MTVALPPDIAAEIEADAEKEMRAAMPSMSNDELKYYLESPYERSLTFRAYVNGAQRLYSLLLEKSKGTFDEKVANQAEKEVVALWNIDRFTREHIGFSFDEGARWQHSQDAVQIEAQRVEIAELRRKNDDWRFVCGANAESCSRLINAVETLEAKLTEAENYFKKIWQYLDDGIGCGEAMPKEAQHVADEALVKIRENK